MPKRDESKYNIIVEGEPIEVTEIRRKILSEFDGLEFVEDGHKYFLGDKELMSVSSLAGQFEEEFNTDERAAAYALKNGMTPEYWKDQWRFKNLRATVTGTQVHSYAESLAWIHMGHPENITDDNLYKYIKDKNWLIPTRHKEVSALNFWQNFPKDFYVVLPETRIYNIGEVYQYAGTFDLLAYYKHPTDDTKSGLVILDWKTNENLYNEFSRAHGKTLKNPFNNLYSEPFGGYTIQTNLYGAALKKIGLKVIARRLVWLKDDETYEIVPVQDVYEVIKMIDNKL